MLKKSSRAGGGQGARSAESETYQLDRQAFEHRATPPSARAADLFSVSLDWFDWRIEALRGIAALMVVFAHYWPLLDDGRYWFQFVFTGVDLFFVLSGFVFAPHLFGKPQPYLPFLIRRGFRIYPFYLVSLGVYVAAHWLTGRTEFPYLVDHLLMLHTTHSKEIAFYYNPAYWSLPPEIEFYLLLPLLARFIAGRNDRFFFLILVSALLHFAIVYYQSPTPTPGITKFLAVLSVHLPGLLIEFLLGVLVWQQLSWRATPRILFLVFLIATMGWIGLAQTWSLLGDEGIQAQALLRGNLGVFAAFCFACFVWVLLKSLPEKPDSRPLWCFVRQISLLIGGLSYGLYLLHNATPMLLKAAGWPAQSPSLFIASLILAFALAAVGHWLVEKPAREYGRWLSRRIVR